MNDSIFKPDPDDWVELMNKVVAAYCQLHPSEMECLGEMLPEERRAHIAQYIAAGIPDPEIEFDGQPDEMQEWHDYDPEC